MEGFGFLFLRRFFLFYYMAGWSQSAVSEKTERCRCEMVGGRRHKSLNLYDRDRRVAVQSGCFERWWWCENLCRSQKLGLTSFISIDFVCSCKIYIIERGLYTGKWELSRWACVRDQPVIMMWALTRSGGSKSHNQSKIVERSMNNNVKWVLRLAPKFP